eukprot:8994906-Pyramimonas_sp.AAC.1
MLEQETVVVYAKDNVFIHPGPRKERISGRLSLVRKVSEDVLFLAWLPYTAQQSTTPIEETTFVMVSDESRSPSTSQTLPQLDGRESVQQRAARTLYAVHPIPLSELRAIRRHTPTLGWHHIILVLHSDDVPPQSSSPDGIWGYGTVAGLTLPPLYFSNGGVKKFLSVLKLHTCLLRSAEDQHTYLVNDIVDPLQRSMTVLNLQVITTKSSYIYSCSSSRGSPFIWRYAHLLASRGPPLANIISTLHIRTTMMTIRHRRMLSLSDVRADYILTRALLPRSFFKKRHAKACSSKTEVHDRAAWTASSPGIPWNE